jgi:hypothetical protein
MVKIGKYYAFNSSALGKIKLKLTKKKSIGNCVYIEGLYKGVSVSALLDKNFKEIIPFDAKVLDNYFASEDLSNVCLAYRYEDSDALEYNHVSLDNNTSELVFFTERFDETPLFVLEAEENKNYWIIGVQKDTPEYAVYDYRRKKIITGFFNEVRVLDDYESDNHCIYFEKYIYDDEDDYFKNKLSSVCGFLDDKGNFSSQVLDTGTQILYNSYNLGGNTLSKNYYLFLDKLQEYYCLIQDEKDNDINYIVSYLFSNPNLSEKPKNYSKNKIVEFKPRKKV